MRKWVDPKPRKKKKEEETYKAMQRKTIQTCEEAKCLFSASSSEWEETLHARNRAQKLLLCPFLRLSIPTPRFLVELLIVYIHYPLENMAKTKLQHMVLHHKKRVKLRVHSCPLTFILIYTNTEYSLQLFLFFVFKFTGTSTTTTTIRVVVWPFPRHMALTNSRLVAFLVISFCEIVLYN